MSGDELMVTLASLALGPAGWIYWFVSTRSLGGFAPANRMNAGPVIGVLLVCALIVQATLTWGAAEDVRGAGQYIFMYSAMGWAWIRVAQWVFPFLGLHPRDDMFERRNAAAVPAWAGATIGMTFCYAGGNVGNGPGWWVVVFSGLLASGALAFVWALVGGVSRLVDAVALDRDPASGWRLGGLLAAAGLIFGFGVTGDWVSAPMTVIDFVMRVWPVLPLAAVAIMIERAAHPTPQRPRGPIAAAGVIPAVIYFAIAVAAVVIQWPRA